MNISTSQSCVSFTPSATVKASSCSSLVNLGKRSKWYMPLPAIQAFFCNIYSLTSKVCFNEKIHLQEHQVQKKMEAKVWWCLWKQRLVGIQPSQQWSVEYFFNFFFFLCVWVRVFVIYCLNFGAYSDTSSTSKKFCILLQKSWGLQRLVAQSRPVPSDNTPTSRELVNSTLGRQVA